MPTTSQSEICNPMIANAAPITRLMTLLVLDRFIGERSAQASTS
jgi:hypothetical protein